MKSWIRHVLPFGFVRATQIRNDLVRLGIPSARASRLAFQGETGPRLHRLNFNLLPPGSLASIDAVIDVGANDGEWTEDLLCICSPRLVVCVEPFPAMAAKLQARFQSHPEVIIKEVAAGERAGTSELNVLNSSVLNSLRTPAANMSGLFPDAFAVKGTLHVNVAPLDAIAPRDRRITILKIDTQGFEREVLSGAADTLGRTDFVIIEINFERHYDGEAGFFELDAIMQRHGFCIGNYSPPKGGRVQALFADFLYVRRDR